MSIEQRIREGLAANAADVAAPVEISLGAVVQRRRRRVRAKVGVAVAATAVLAATPWAAGTWLAEQRATGPATPAEVGLEGRYSVEVAAVGRTAELAGTWLVTLSDEGDIEVEPPAGYDGLLPGTGESYDVVGDELRTNLYLGWPGCQQADPPIGRYRVEVTSTGLAFMPIQDVCPPRRQLFDVRWVRVS